MNNSYKKNYLFLLTLAMISLTIAKINFLYLNTVIPKHNFLAFARTAVLLTAIYVLVNYVFFRKSFALKLIFHELLALIILSELTYYKYFDAWPSFGELKMLPEALEAWESVKSLLKPVYMLFFADLLILVPINYRFGKGHSLIKYKRRCPAMIAAILILITTFDCIAYSKDSYQTFESFGLLHFHVKKSTELPKENKPQDFSSFAVKNLENISNKNKTKPKYFGAAKGRNVIIVQVEALQEFVINMSYNGQVLTPNLNKLIKKDSIFYDSYYQSTGKGNTSDAEFATLNSLYADSQTPSYTKYQKTNLYGLPKILKDRGYSTAAFHGFKGAFWNRDKVYPTIGIDTFLSLETLKKDEIIGWGVSDKSFFKQVTEYLSQTKKPFFGFLITLSTHHPYKLPDQYNTLKLMKEHKNNIIGDYLQAVHYTDAAIGEFMEELKAAGLYDSSVIAIYGDHQAITCYDEKDTQLMTELLGYQYDVDEMINIPLIIHIPNSKIKKTNSIASSQIDLMPTMLNLLGINKGNINFYGQDLNNAKNGFAAAQSMVPRGTFIDDEKVFVMNKDGIFEHGRAWDRKTRKPIKLELCRAGYERAVREIKECEYLLTNNMLYKKSKKTNI